MLEMSKQPSFRLESSTDFDSQNGHLLHWAVARNLAPNALSDVDVHLFSFRALHSECQRH
jgi:hypothetical protein